MNGEINMKRLLIMLVILGCSNVAHAIAPTISNVSGTVATGQTLTITGTNMMQENKTNWTARFQGTSYNFANGSYSTPDNNNYSYTDAGNTTGAYDSTVFLESAQSLKYEATASVGSGQVTDGGAWGFSPPANFWIRGYVRYNSANNIWPEGHLKMFGIATSNGMCYLQPACNLDASAPTSMTATCGTAASTATGPIPSGAIKNGQWYLIEEQISGGNTMNVWVDGVQVISNYTFASFSGGSFMEWGIINMADSGGNFVHNVDISHWIQAFTISSARPYASAFIEISGDGGSTWTYQPPTYISETSSTITANLPTLTAAHYILRVTNNGQLVAASGNTATAGGATYTFGSGSSQVNGACGSDNGGSLSSLSSTDSNLCSSGTVSGFTGTGPWTWGCNGSGGGSSTSSTACTASKSVTAVNGACGSANGQSFASLTSASSNLCSTGTVASFSGTGPWSWGCNGSGGGTSTSVAACAASLTLTSSPTATLLFSENFEDENFAARGWYDNTNHGTIASGGQSGNCLQWAWTSGQTTPTNGGSMRYNNFTPTDTLYLSYYVKFQTGWEGSQQTYHPHMMYILSDLDNAANAYSPLADNYLNTYVEFLSDIGSPYTIRPQIALQDEKRTNTSNGTPPNDLTAITENRSVNYCNTPVSSGATGTCYADVTYYSANTWKAASASVSTNAWHHIEVYFQMNSISGGIGQHDGIMQEWVDGTQVMNHSDVLYRTNQDSTKKWAQFVLAPYIGTGSPITQTMWIDSLQVWNGNPNSSSTSMSSPAGFAVKSVSP